MRNSIEELIHVVVASKVSSEKKMAAYKIIRKLVESKNSIERINIVFYIMYFLNMELNDISDRKFVLKYQLKIFKVLLNMCIDLFYIIEYRLRYDTLIILYRHKMESLERTSDEEHNALCIDFMKTSNQIKELINEKITEITAQLEREEEQTHLPPKKRKYFLNVGNHEANKKRKIL